MNAASLVALVMLFAGNAMPTAVAEPVYRHSGTVVAIVDRGMVVEEVGPWKVVNGRTQVRRLVITVPRRTPITGVVRDEEAPSGFVGDFIEVWAGFGDIRLGDFVTVECVHEGARMIARRVTIVELEPAQ